MMKSTLLQEYIAQQPALWRALLDSREEITAEFSRRFGGFQPDRVILVGSGSSHYAALMARPVLEHAWGTEVTCLVPSEAADARLTAAHPLYFAISQSGVSTNTYDLVCQLTNAGRAVIAVTEQANSPVGLAASLSVPLRIGTERIGAKTKGVTATVLTLMLLALSVCQDTSYGQRMLQALDRLCRNAPENLSRSRAWSHAHRNVFLPFRHLYVLGCGNSLGAAQEGALKLLETNYLPVSCYPLDEYIHGIQNALDGDACLLCLLPSQGPDRDRMLRLVNFSKSVGACCGLISPSDTGQPDAPHLLDAGEDALQSLEFLLALQTLAAELSAARGIDSSHRRYSDFFSIMGSKMEGDICQPKL